MKLHTGNIVIAMLALVLASAISLMAQQTAAPTTQKTQSESCCAMDSCCKGDSCAMHKEGSTPPAGTDECCCSGDSCDMKSGEMVMSGADASKNSADMAKHSMHDKKNHSSCCNMKDQGSSGDMKMEGSCCNMKHDGASSDMKHEGCCCNMKQKDKQKEAKK